jgi:hypothetical protein
VVLLEPTDHVGGLSTGGLSHCDSNQMVRSTVMGLFHEWHTRIVKDYTDHDLQSVTKEGLRIVSLATKRGAFTARVFIDGSYEGDLMAAAGVDWTIGREGRADSGERQAGKRYPKRGMAINGFGEAGEPLPLVTAQERGEETAGDANLMAYSFRLCLTKDPKNKVPMTAPATYDPARFEIIRRYLAAGGDPNQVGLDLYPLPGGKVDGNNSIGRQFSIGLVGGGTGWHAADEAGREEIWEAHRQYTLEFLHFLTHDPAVPKQLRDRYAQLGFCKDEFADHGHFSPALYVRESRRLQGLSVISQKDIINEPAKADPIAISSFPIDSHDCRRVAVDGGGVVNEGTIYPVRKGRGQGYAYHVPYRAVLPKPGQCDNLLVPVALSCTHVGMSSLRIEAAWMVIGQGTGVAAALAAKDDVAVQDVPYETLRGRLLAQGAALDLPAAGD